MEKLTKETKIWTAVLLLGMLILAVVRAIIAISQMPPIAGVEVGPSLYMMTVVGGLFGMLLAIALPAFINKVIVSVVAAESQFSYGVSLFYMTIMVFIINVLSLGLETALGMTFFMEHAFIVSLVFGAIIVAGYCALLVYDKRISVKQAVLSGGIIFALNELIRWGMAQLVSNTPPAPMP
ncbi:hypothetical protein NHG33_06915 [Aerococcaceae bacterium NML130460]|nr:hypothetical protein [Aerococcaceae bacterium NML171108]MCW6680920.1 hypothetical protein [Aerococcaceae bacterium NML130460]